MRRGPQAVLARTAGGQDGTNNTASEVFCRTLSVRVIHKICAGVRVRVMNPPGTWCRKRRGKREGESKRRGQGNIRRARMNQESLAWGLA